VCRYKVFQDVLLTLKLSSLQNFRQQVLTQLQQQLKTS